MIYAFRQYRQKIYNYLKQAFMLLLAFFAVVESFFFNFEYNEVQAENIIYTFDYTGNYQEFVVPKTGTYKVQLWGAQGGASLENNSVSTVRVGGYGAYTAGLVELQEGQKIYIYYSSSVMSSFFKTKRNSAPPPALFSALISPLCALMMVAQTERPIPKFLFFVSPDTSFTS